MADLTPKFSLLPAEQEITIPPSPGDSGPQVVGGFVASNNGLQSPFLNISGVSQNITVGAATSPTVGIGIYIGSDQATSPGYDFRVGDPATKFIWWDASASTFKIQGAFQVGNSITLTTTDDIQTALTALSSTGGIVYLLAGTWTLSADITVPSNVSLVGSGIDVSILDFNSTVKQLIASSASNFELRGFTVKNSHHTTSCVEISACHQFAVNFVRSTANWGDGFRLDSSYQFSVSNCKADNNVHVTTNDGFHYFMPSTSGNEPRNIIFYNCISDTNGGYGFYVGYGFLSGTGSLDSRGPLTIENCYATACTLEGFRIEDVINSGSRSELHAVYINCSAYFNWDQAGLLGTPLDGISPGFSCTMHKTKYIGCTSEVPAASAFKSTVNDTQYIGCLDDDTASFNLPTGADPGLFVGNSVSVGSGNDATFSRPPTSFKPMVDLKLQTVKNTSGGTLTVGQVVVLKNTYTASSNITEITTTTTAGDNKVYGMIYDASIANNASGQILVLGGTASLKVNGTTAIAKGDYLTCFTVAGIAAKAAAGNAVFAMALAAYAVADSNGVIEALILSPRPF